MADLVVLLGPVAGHIVSKGGVPFPAVFDDYLVLAVRSRGMIAIVGLSPCSCRETVADGSESALPVVRSGLE